MQWANRDTRCTRYSYKHGSKWANWVHWCNCNRSYWGQRPYWGQWLQRANRLHWRHSNWSYRGQWDNGVHWRHSNWPYWGQWDNGANRESRSNGTDCYWT